MELGWIDFSKTERNKVLSILDLLGERGVLDELGLPKFVMPIQISFFRELQQFRPGQSIF